MKPEDDILFQAASTSSARFTKQSPPPKDLVAAVAGFQLEAAIGETPDTAAKRPSGRTKTDATPKTPSEPMVEFGPRKQAPAPAAPPKPRIDPAESGVRRGPLVIDPERAKKIVAKPPLLARVIEFLVGWMRG
ncbi:MAG: hypothetical protein HZB39_14485 [Planctomycetes bacterium]|nr:hypothetical protein [Planctomycetota bacterium]